MLAIKQLYLKTQRKKYITLMNIEALNFREKFIKAFTAYL